MEIKIVETLIFTAKAFCTRLRRRKSIVLPRCQINKYYTATKRETVLKPIPLIKWGMLKNLTMYVLLKL